MHTVKKPTPEGHRESSVFCRCLDCLPGLTGASMIFSKERAVVGYPSLQSLLLAAGTTLVLILADRARHKGRRQKQPRILRQQTDATAICPNCCRPLQPSRHFCRHCRTPVTGYAATGPLESILAQGELFRRSVSHPTTIGVLGLWLLALLGILQALGSVIWDERPGVVLLSLGTCTLALAISVKATKAWRSRLPGRGLAGPKNRKGG